MRLLARSSRRYLTRRPLRLLLAIGGVALGVSVVVAIDLVNASATRAFRLSTETIAGRATHQISGGSAGLDEAVFARLVSMPGAPPLAPIVEDSVVVLAEDGRERPRSLRLLGVEPFSERPFRDFLLSSGQAGAGATAVDWTRLLREPGTVVLSRETARELELEAGSAFRVRVGTSTRELRLLGTIDPTDESVRAALSNLVFADVTTAQETLGSIGRLTRIEAIVDGESPAAARTLAALERELPAGAVLRPTEARTEALETMTRAFRLNLRALSWLALLCGALLIYNTMSFSVIERRSLFGLLRSVGASRREVLAMVLGEAAAIGVIGSAIGAVAGILLGRGLVVLVTQTIQDLYFSLSVREAAAAGGSVGRGLAVGVAVALLAAAAPAREAMAVDPRAAISRSAVEVKARRSSRRLLVGGLAFGALGAFLLWLPVHSLVLAFVGLFAVLAGGACLAPAATAGFGRLVSRLPGVGFRTRLAARGLVASLSRTGVAVAALSLAVATAIGVDLMIGSFRGAVETWLGGTLSADFYLSPPGRVGDPTRTSSLDADLVAEVRALRGVERAHTLRTTLYETPGGEPTRVSGSDLVEPGFAAFDFFGTDAASVWAGWRAGGAVVSEPFAYRRRLRVGDSLEFATPNGRRRAPIAGVFRDYGSDRGVVVLHESAFRELWPAAPVVAMSVFARPEASDAERAALERELRGLERGALKALKAPSKENGAGGRHFLVQAGRGLREGSMAVFDRTFRVTGVLRLLALLVAVLGVLAALTSLELERGREFGVLRAAGMTPGELARLTLSETGLLGLAAGLIAMPLGALLSAILVYVINRRSFGWTMQLEVTPGPFLLALGLALGAALAAGVYPAWRSSRILPAEALRSE